MAPRGRKKMAGLMREDAARDRMRDFGFPESIISESIKQVLEVYDGHWRLIEEQNYDALLTVCLEKREEKDKQLAEIQNEEMVEDQNEEQAEEEQPNQLVEEQEEEMKQEQEQEHDMLTEYERDLADELSITSEAAMDLSSPAIHLGEASAGYALNSVEGIENLHCGMLSDEEETDPEEEETYPKEDSDDDDDDDDDDEMIRLTPEPLCEELEILLREVRGQNERKKETRWDKQTWG